MIVARQKRKENIAEYLLYMWQVEDLIRANRFDMDAIRKSVIAHYDQRERGDCPLVRGDHRHDAERRGHGIGTHPTQ